MKCVHHWLIESPSSDLVDHEKQIATLSGKCRKCGAEKIFVHTLESDGRRPGVPRKGVRRGEASPVH